MARGFESKDVEFQQAEHARVRAADRGATTKRAESSRRHALELSLTHARAELARATNPHHQRMLTDAIGALERQLRDAE